MLDKKTFTIGVLTLSAVILAVANILAPLPAAASFNTIKDSDFQMLTATSVAGGDAVYITDNRSGIMAVYQFDPQRGLIAIDAQPVQNAFAKMLKR